MAAAPPQAQDWSFIQNSRYSQTNSHWIYPQGSYQLYPRGWYTYYTITFNLDCPQNPLVFTYSSTGYTFVYINDKLIKSMADPYPTFNTVTIYPSDLKCGCNTIRVLVYNFCCSSPAALTYRLTQDSTGCYSCEREGITFYNRDTCRC